MEAHTKELLDASKKKVRNNFAKYIESSDIIKALEYKGITFYNPSYTKLLTNVDKLSLESHIQKWRKEEIEEEKKDSYYNTESIDIVTPTEIDGLVVSQAQLYKLYDSLVYIKEALQNKLDPSEVVVRGARLMNILERIDTNTKKTVGYKNLRSFIQGLTSFSPNKEEEKLSKIEEVLEDLVHRMYRMRYFTN